MIIPYLIKSAACLGILFLFYKLFLEKETMHVFKRFYLLASLLFAFIVPALVFIEYVEVVTPDYSRVQSVPPAEEVINVPPALESDIIDIAPLLWGAYFIGFLFFGMKFLRNLFQIFKRIRNNPKNKLARCTQVLLKESLPPHTFFRYIFLNKQKLAANEIPKEVLLHEETHARQRHSWDVVSIELLQVVFWINPFVYLIKKAVKLNHEFLADQAVLKKDINRTTYQNTLLSYLSPDSEKKYQPTMANLITNSSYSSIKKRFTVMKTHTSKNSILLRSLLLLPLLALLLYGFSETKTEIISIPRNMENAISADVFAQPGIVTVSVHIYKDGTLHLDNRSVSLEEIESHLTELAHNEAFIKAAIHVDFEAPEEVIGEMKNMFEKYKVHQIDIIGSEESDSQKQYQNGATKKELATFNILAEKYNQQPKASRTIPLKDLKTLESIFRKMNATQRENSQPFPECDSPADQDGATKEQVEEYNALARSYNRQLNAGDAIRIYISDVERLEYIYSLMTPDQKENAEPFPDFPEPPPAPKGPGALKGEKSSVPPPPLPPSTPITEEEEEVFLEEQEAQMRQQEMQTEAQEILTEQQQARTEQQEIVIEEQETALFEQETESGIQEPPVPPNPKSPLDHVIEMAKKDATFYYEGKEISSDKAIAILKNNESINVDSRSSNSERPVVRLSTAPISFDE